MIINTGSINGVYYLGFTTPAVKYVHWRPTLVSTTANQVTMVLYEGLGYSGGSAITPFNRKRTSLNITTMTSTVKGASSTPGSQVVIDSASYGSSGNPSSRSGGNGGAENELILKRSNAYTMALTPAGATIVIADLFWYEEDKG